MCWVHGGFLLGRVWGPSTKGYDGQSHVSLHQDSCVGGAQASPSSTQHLLLPEQLPLIIPQSTHTSPLFQFCPHSFSAQSPLEGSDSLNSIRQITIQESSLAPSTPIDSSLAISLSLHLSESLVVTSAGIPASMMCTGPLLKEFAPRHSPLTAFDILSDRIFCKWNHREGVICLGSHSQ